MYVGSVEGLGGCFSTVSEISLDRSAFHVYTNLVNVIDSSVRS